DMKASLSGHAPGQSGQVASKHYADFIKPWRSEERRVGKECRLLCRFRWSAYDKENKGLLEGTLQAGTSAVSDKLLDLVGLGGKSAADKGKDTRDYLAAAFPELNA